MSPQSTWRSTCTATPGGTITSSAPMPTSASIRVLAGRERQVAEVELELADAEPVAVVEVGGDVGW